MSLFNTLSLWQVRQLRVLDRYIREVPLARMAILHLGLRLCGGDVAIGDLVVLGTVCASTAVSDHCPVFILVSCCFGYTQSLGQCNRYLGW